jgi:hypothetical protein
VVLVPLAKGALGGFEVEGDCPNFRMCVVNGLLDPIRGLMYAGKGDVRTAANMSYHCEFAI